MPSRTSRSELALINASLNARIQAAEATIRRMLADLEPADGTPPWVERAIRTGQIWLGVMEPPVEIQDPAVYQQPMGGLESDDPGENS